MRVSRLPVEVATWSRLLNIRVGFRTNAWSLSLSLPLPRLTKLAAIVARRAPHVDYSIWTATHRWVRFLEPAQHNTPPDGTLPHRSRAHFMARSFVTTLHHTTSSCCSHCALLHPHLAQLPSNLVYSKCHHHSSLLCFTRHSKISFSRLPFHHQSNPFHCPFVFMLM